MSLRPLIYSDEQTDWRERLDIIVEMMREMSSHTEPEAMVRAYSERMRSFLQTDRSISLSRRDLAAPWYRITRFSEWEQTVNPWKQADELPLLDRGLLGELLYRSEPCILDNVELAPDDPAVEYLGDYRSWMAVPLYDQGLAINMVVLARAAPNTFDPRSLPGMVWMANLFGRATHNLVLRERLTEANRTIDHELQVISDIQRSLLAQELPQIDGLDLAAHYATAREAGGDYYDFLPLGQDEWGILIADVSGHGTPAAVIMAILHSIVHTYPERPDPPEKLLTYVNNKLAARYTSNGGTFVTAFYGIYNPDTRTLRYSSAGHPPPRLKRCTDGSVHQLDGASGLPLGVATQATYEQASYTFVPGDQIVFYTDGVTEARNMHGNQFGDDGLDRTLANCGVDAQGLVRTLLDELAAFTHGQPADDDRTIVVARVTRGRAECTMKNEE